MIAQSLSNWGSLPMDSRIPHGSYPSFGNGSPSAGNPYGPYQHPVPGMTHVAPHLGAHLGHQPGYVGVATTSYGGAAGLHPGPLIVACPKCGQHLMPPLNAPIFACPCGQKMAPPRQLPLSPAFPVPPAQTYTYGGSPMPASAPDPAEKPVTRHVRCTQCRSLLSSSTDITVCALCGCHFDSRAAEVSGPESSNAPATAYAGRASGGYSSQAPGAPVPSAPVSRMMPAGAYPALPPAPAPPPLKPPRSAWDVFWNGS